jgi:hypothetical protein
VGRLRKRWAISGSYPPRQAPLVENCCRCGRLAALCRKSLIRYSEDELRWKAQSQPTRLTGPRPVPQSDAVNAGFQVLPISRSDSSRSRNHAHDPQGADAREGQMAPSPTVLCPRGVNLPRSFTPLRPCAEFATQPHRAQRQRHRDQCHDSDWLDRRLRFRVHAEPPVKRVVSPFQTPLEAM